MQKRVHNSSFLKDARKELRNNLTHEEAILWSYLKQSRLGYKFRRQHSVGRFILDFYCNEKKLAIELDGNQHLESQEYDTERTNFLNSLGIQVVRFRNDQIHIDITGVILGIKALLK